jgi:hypothetical protein
VSGPQTWGAIVRELRTKSCRGDVERTGRRGEKGGSTGLFGILFETDSCTFSALEGQRCEVQGETEEDFV